MLLLRMAQKRHVKTGKTSRACRMTPTAAGTAWQDRQDTHRARTSRASPCSAAGTAARCRAETSRTWAPAAACLCGRGDVPGKGESRQLYWTGVLCKNWKNTS